MPDPTADSTVFGKVPAWVYLLIGLSGGGSASTLINLGGLDKESVRDVVQEEMEANNAVIIQRIELMFANERLRKLSPLE